MDNYNKKIGQWLAHQREARGLLQQDIGDKLGVTKTAISYWETGKRTIDASTMIEYCNALGVDPQDLVRDVVNEK